MLASPSQEGTGLIGAAGAITQFFRLTFLRPIERFLAQVISISTGPTAFVRERIHLGDTTNFLRAAGFFVSAISSAFLAEVATLYLLGIGNLVEPYYWLFILLTSIPFVLFSFLLVRLVAPLSLKDVLHLSFPAIGAGVFTGAVFALVSSAVVASLVAVGFIDKITFDFSQWGEDEQLYALYRRVLMDCLNKESFLHTIVATGSQEAYSNLRSPINGIGYVRPIIALLYLVIAARVFAAAVDRRKLVVFVMVLLAALVATAVRGYSLGSYLDWSAKSSDCNKTLGERGLERAAESVLKHYAHDALPQENEVIGVSVKAEGRTLFYTWRLKRPLEMGAFHRIVAEMQRDDLEEHCSDPRARLLRILDATERHTFYSPEGAWLSSFSIGPADCPQ